MWSNVVVVAEQVAVLFILISLGFISGKTGLINESGAKYITNIVLYLATPCIMIKSFQKVGFSPELIVNLALCALCAFLIMLVSIVICRATFKSKNENRRLVMRFAAVFSNCGFMSLPLQQAVLGDKGVFYGTVFVAVFNIIVWSYGLLDMSGDKGSFKIKKIILNPGFLGAFSAVCLFLLKIQLPPVLLSPIEYIAGLNTPLPMLVIGYYLTGFKLKKSLTDIHIYTVSAVRLLLIPCFALFVMKFFSVNNDIIVSCTVAASAPSAAMTTMFSAKFNRDTEFSVAVVSATTLLSIITMPVIIALAQTIG